MELHERRRRSRSAGYRGAASGAALALALFSAPASAHDYWLVPEQLVLPAGQEVGFRLFVGEDFVAEEEKRFETSRASRLIHAHGGQSVDLLRAAVDGATPMLRLPLEGSGGHLIALDRNLARIELPAEKFEAYLQHEGLLDVAAERARRGESGKPGRERYTRCLKALVQVGDSRDDTFAKVVGQALEIVPESDPVLVASGEQLKVAIQYRGAPLPKVRIEAFSRVGGDVRGAVLTADERGIVAVPIDRRGVWLVRMVHMVRCEGCADADWESAWASYVFASRPPEGGAVAAPPMLGAAPGSEAASRAIPVYGIAAAIGAILAAVVTFLVMRRVNAGRQGPSTGS